MNDLNVTLKIFHIFINQKFYIQKIMQKLQKMHYLVSAMHPNYTKVEILAFEKVD